MAPLIRGTVLLFLVGVVACIGPFADPTGGPVVTLRADDLRFDPDRLTVPAGAAWRLHFENLERDIPHNVAIYAGDEQLFHAPTTFGVSMSTYDLAPLDPGEYPFRCEIHPLTMFGALTAG